MYIERAEAGLRRSAFSIDTIRIIALATIFLYRYLPTVSVDPIAVIWLSADSDERYYKSRIWPDFGDWSVRSASIMVIVIWFSRFSFYQCWLRWRSNTCLRTTTKSREIQAEQRFTSFRYPLTCFTLPSANFHCIIALPQRRFSRSTWILQ